MNEEFLKEVAGYFSKEEWSLWVKGEFSLFDNYVERVGMSKEDADRLRAGKGLCRAPKAKTRYQEFLEKPLDIGERIV